MDLTTLDGCIAITLILSTVTTGLLAGLYFGFSCAVMPGLAVSSDRTFVETMRRINQKILNGWFLAVFMGNPILPIVAIILLALDGDTEALWWTIVGAAFNVISLGITAGRSVPLNSALDEAGPVDAISDPGAIRAAFEAPWVRLNLARTIASSLGLIALAVALLVR